MPSLVNEILQLHNQCEYLLFSRKGALLFNSTRSLPELTFEQEVFFGKIIAHLQYPLEARFVFAKATLLISQNEIGFIIVISKSYEELEEVAGLCAQAREIVVGRSKRRRLLLTMLHEASDRTKLTLLEELAPLADEEISSGLMQLLSKREEFSKEFKDQLLLTVCRILGDCESSEAIGPLTAFIDECEQAGKGYSKDVVTEARVSLQQLELLRQQYKTKPPEREKERNLVTDRHQENEKLTPLIRNRQKTKSGIVQPESAPVQQKAMPHSQEGPEQKIKHLLGQGKKREAVALIMKYIEAAAQQRMFARAERLRDMLIKIDSMMLKEIIRAAEIIEESKAANIDPEHQEVLVKLIEMLGTEEFNSLYHAMTLQKCAHGESIVKPGTFLPHLLLVMKGQVQVYAMVNGKEVPLKTVRSGEVIEAESFFEASVWTVGVRSLGAEIFALPRKNLEVLREKHPSLESRLIDYAAGFASANELFRKTRRSRRRHERKKMTGRASATLLDKLGKETEVSFKGDLFDISRGGMSFLVRVSKKKNAILLFGKRISISIPTGSVAANKYQSHIGRIIAVKGHHIVGNEYSLHVEFDRELTHEEMRRASGE